MPTSDRHLGMQDPAVWHSSFLCFYLLTKFSNRAATNCCEGPNFGKLIALKRRGGERS
jgi:hypothetical protein